MAGGAPGHSYVLRRFLFPKLRDNGLPLEVRSLLCFHHRRAQEPFQHFTSCPLLVATRVNIDYRSLSTSSLCTERGTQLFNRVNPRYRTCRTYLPHPQNSPLQSAPAFLNGVCDPNWLLTCTSQARGSRGSFHFLECLTVILFGIIGTLPNVSETGKNPWDIPSRSLSPCPPSKFWAPCQISSPTTGAR